MLPRAGDRVVVRGLMTGELQRVYAAADWEQSAVLVCLCLEDPNQPGAPLLNVNDMNDRAIAAGLHIDDSTAIVDKQNEMAGLTLSDKELLGNSGRVGSSSSSSPPAGE